MTASQLSRKLSENNLIAIAIGGTIGTGLFVGSGFAISSAGSVGSLLAFSVIGLFVYLIMICLAEMAAFNPVSGSFTTFAAQYVDEALGFSIGWNYYFQWAISLPSEVSAASIVLSFWAPNVPSWIWSISMLLMVLACNVNVSSFGKSEILLSIIKITAIILFIIVGFFLDTGLIKGSPFQGFQSWKNDIIFKNGIYGFFQASVFAFFAFGGTELIGITAGETQNPEIAIPKAIKGTFFRIFIFYILSIFILTLLISPDDPLLMSAAESSDITIAPFTLVFEKAGISFASHVMNGIVLVACLSAANSSLYASSRTLMTLASEGKAPSVFSKVHESTKVPLHAMMASIMIACISFFGIFFGNGLIFSYLITFSSMSGLITWICIAITHLRFRYAILAQGLDASKILPYQSYLFPFAPIIALIMGVFIATGQIWLAITKENASIGSILLTVASIPVFVLLYTIWKKISGCRLIELHDIPIIRNNSSELKLKA